MIVALRATNRGAKPDRRRRVDAINQDVKARFFVIHAAFLVQQGVAMKTAGNLLIQRGIGQHIACDLLNRELIERHIFVERIDHPIAVLPHHARAIFFVAVGIGIAR